MNWYLKVIKNYADFKGRARRKEYWQFVLFHILIVIGIEILMGLLAFISPSLTIVGMILLWLYMLAMIVPSLAVGVRRMHDTGNSGWFLLIPIYSFILAVTDSKPGENQWGPNPKEVNDEKDQESLDGHLAQ